jgi:hypothetical protein
MIIGYQPNTKGLNFTATAYYHHIDLIIIYYSHKANLAGVVLFHLQQ